MTPIPDNKQLRLFGLALAGAILFWLVIISWLNDFNLLSASPMLISVWFLVILLIGLALFKPAWLAGTFRVWMVLVGWLNQAITGILLGSIFLLVITPVGLIRRLFGHPGLRHKPTLPDSYRSKSEPLTRDDLEHPY